MNIRGYNGNQLKLIAVVTMLADHIGYLLIGQGVLPAVRGAGREADIWMAVYMLLRCIGRVAFPIFCFLLVEGFFHSRDRKQYAIRLGLFALFSEIPFDLMSAGSWPYWQGQNVFFTLLLGFILLSVLERLPHLCTGQRRLVLQLLAIMLFCGASWLIRCDYDFTGIMLISLLYWYRGDRRQACLLGFLWMGLAGAALYLLPGLAAAFWLISRYNGELGRSAKNRAAQYFFYLFYPVHIWALYLVYVVLMNGR